MIDCDDSMLIDPMAPPRGAPSYEELRGQNGVLRQRLAQLEEALRAIRGGEVDGLFVAGAQGDRFFTLDGADRAYRQLVEEMGEGALTLTREGVTR